MSAAGHDHGVLSRITAAFVDSKLVPLIVAASLLLGVFAVLATPSEEEPQIVVPMIDIHVSMPGASPAEVENRVIGPMEKILWEIPGVEYVYSTAMDGRALTIVRYKVGEDTEKSLVKTYGKLYQHLDWIPPGCSKPILKPHSIDDVPILVLTFHQGGDGDGRFLRDLAAQVNEEVRQVPGVAETTIIGGRKRAVMVEPDMAKLRANGLDMVDVIDTLAAQNQGETIGDATQEGAALNIRLDNFYRSVSELGRTVLARRDGRTVFLADVANIRDGSPEPRDYVFFVTGAASGGKTPPGTFEQAVSLAVAKRTGVNATKLAEAVMRKVEDQKGFTIPDGVKVTVTRNYGDTAKDKVDELLKHLILAALSVGGIVALFLGMRASFVVMVAVPVTLAITLATYYFLGYTLNRVTLFALIFCIGILVDDPIVDVENIVRHIDLPGSGKKPFTRVIVEAVNEVRAPLVLATFTVIAAIMPMAFVGGLMGPYMRPMPVGASVAMLLSMSVAFVITPWTARRTLKPVPSGHAAHGEDAGTKLYRALMARLIGKPAWRYGFLGMVAGLLLLACALFPWRVVLVKMLPFDNKSEFQIVVDMPDGTSLEKTAQAAEEIARIAAARPEVTDVEVYAGTAGPVSFNGLIRHYYLREGQNSADLNVNLAPKGDRKLQSHDIAKAVRASLADTAARLGAKVKVAEVPPGPPVLQTLVAEIYGPTGEGRLNVARQVKEVFRATPNLVDVDWYVSDPMPERLVRIEREKALLSGIDPKRALDVVSAAYKGTVAGLLHDEAAREDVPIVVRAPLADRSHALDLSSVPIRGQGGSVVSLDQAARLTDTVVPSAIYHKNLQPVIYVTGDMAGSEESPVYGMSGVEKGLAALDAKDGGAWRGSGQDKLNILYARQPESLKDFSLKWDGEWQITYEVFRDMGLAFAVVMVLIYILVVGWFGSYTTPLAIMAPIPLSLIGIIPAHALAGAFFTATSMIGFIAGAGIVVRNSIILVDFIEMRRGEGASLEDAVVEAGAVRFRPMLLTAISVVAGAFVILFDPIFQGLAISLMAGEVAATVFSRMVVPVMYYLDRRRAKDGV